jgi:hypothetical protein
MPKKTNTMQSGGYQIGRLMDQSGGMVDSVVYPTLLNDNEAAGLTNASLDEKGTVKTCKGRIERFASPLDSSPVAGMGTLYTSDGVSRLLIGTEGGKLYVDTPHIINTYDTQANFNGGSNFAVQADAGGKLWPMIVSTGFEDGLFDDFHTRDSGWMIDDTVYKTGAKSAKGTGTSQKLIREFGKNVDQLYVKLAVRFAETNQVHYPVIFKSPTDTEIHTVVADSDGSFKYHNGTGLTALPVAKTYLANTWYVIEVWVRGGAFWINIDGTCHTPSGLTMKDTANAAQTQVSKFQVQNAGGTAATTWIDDVTINLLGAVFSRASVAYKSDGTQVAANQPRYETVGSVHGVMVEEGTTNLPTNPNFESGNTGWAFQGDAIIENVAGRTGNWRAKATTDGTGAHRHIKQLDLPVTAGLSYTLSVYAKRLSGTADFLLLCAWKKSDGTTISLIQSPAFTPSDLEYTRHIFTVTAPAEAVKADFYIYQGAPTVGVIAYDDAQFEAKPYPTAFQVGTRAPEVLTIPTTGVFNKGNWAVELTFKPTSNQIGSWNTLWHIQYDSNNYWWINTPNTTGYLRGGVVANGIIYMIESNIVPQVDSIYKIMLSGDGSVLRFCINGVQIGTDLAYIEPSVNLPITMFVGCNSAGISQANGIISDLRISSRARTLAEHQAEFNSGLPLTMDEHTTLLMSCNGSLDVSASHHWISPVIDCSNASDKGSGHAALTATTPGASTVAIASRSAPASTGPWTEWAAALGDGTLQHAADNYVQVRVTLARDGENDPYVDKLVVSFDGQAAATLLASDFVAGGQFYFDTLLSKMVVVNKLNAPRKYDGTTLSALGGSPPSTQYVAAHRNFLFMAHSAANSSRLYFSEVINPESWPALNFIDISPNDGDWITGLLPFDDYLLITKQRSVWVLVGTGTSDFEVKRIHSGIGCVAPRSLVRMGDLFGFASTEGYYLSDITKPVLITERLKDTWDGLNKRRLSQIAAEFYDHKLRIDAPNGNSMVNNIRIIYDSIRKCLYLEEFDDHASCYAKYTEAGQEILLYGHSTEGQVSQADDGTSDAGAAIDFEWKTKHFNFGSSATEKKVRNTYIAAVPAASDVTLSVYFIVDNVEVGTPISVTVSGSANEDVKTYKLKPRDVGIRKVRTLGYRIVQSTTNGGVKIHELLQEYLTKKIKAS